MGQNSPIELKMTAAGLAAKDSVDNIFFTRFVAGAGGNNLATEVAEVKQTIPIVDYQKYTAGNTYNINGVNTVATESSLKLTGFANAIDAESNYILNEIGLMAKLTEDGEEFCFAYDWSDTDTRRVRITRSQGIQVVYNIIFSRQPNLTIDTTATGVTYADFYSHTQSPVSAAPVHGMTWENGQLTINGQVFDGASNERLKKLVGIDLFYTILPQPVMALYNKVALMTTTSDTYRCQKTQEINVGQFIINDNGWKRANGSEAEALLVIDDGLTPSANEICLTDAQNHFMEWVQLENIDLRLSALEANAQFLQYDPLDDRVYNSEWVDRMTGSGTPGSPFCIYTPKDFSMIGRTEQYGLDKCYKLMNNLDFSELCGMELSIEDDSYNITTTNQQAPLYNNGEGLWPVGYDGYYPTCYEARRGKTWQEIVDNGSAFKTSSNGGYVATIHQAGYEYYAFSGELDGNSKVLKGIVCAPVNTFSVGLFMLLTKNASVHNLTIKDSIFILSDVVLSKEGNYELRAAIGSVAGMLTAAGISNGTFTVNISNVYNYATLINNVTIYGSVERIYTAGILGWNSENTTEGYIISNCANHGQLICTSDTPNAHYVAGIVNSDNAYDNIQEIINCINTASFTGKLVRGLGSGYSSGVNINCGFIQSNVSNESFDYVIPSTGTAKSNDSCSFFNNQTPNTINTLSTSARVRFYPKTPEYLKSEEFIIEANSYLAIPAFVYNDLGVNDGWPLLVDEYNTLIGINGNLSLAVVDPSNKKIYKSGLPMKKFQTIPTYREMVENTNQTVETKINTFNSEVLAGLKIVTVTIASTNWSAETDLSGTSTGKYVATKSITGMTATSPVQLLSQISEDEVKIKTTSNNSVEFICDSEPASDIKVSVMFTV